MIKDKVKELVEKSYEELKRNQFHSKEEFWGMLTAQTQRAVQTINEYAGCNDQIFNLCIKGAMSIEQCQNDKNQNITDIMLEKAVFGITELIKCALLLKRFKNPGIKSQLMEETHVSDKKEE